MFFLGYYCSPDDSVRRYRRDHSPEEAVTEDNYQEELEDQEEEQEYEYQEEDQEDKEESYVVEASLPDVLPVSWQQPVLLPDLLDQGSDTTDGAGSKENNAGSTGHGRGREERSGVEGEERVEDGRGEESRWRSEGRHLKMIAGMDQVIELLNGMSC